ncbi:unnamed protein product [Zymoseptoria tritici ST99CH_3D1]|nr:unnamed protein product [Zymoseptoria tritici ST99CH_3D1]
MATTDDIKIAEFPQLIDHGNPSLGTFQQKYYYQAASWKGPGSPIILFASGENNASDTSGLIVSEFGTYGVLAEQIGAAAIALEHRYYGDSSPFEALTTENLQYLTVKNVIKDLTYFAQNVDLPFVTPTGSSTAKDVPWVLVGGSYTGAIAAWTAVVDPGTFWTYYASSPLTEVINDFWQYYVPIQHGMPQNCSKDASALIDHMDDILLRGSKEDITALKARFNFESLPYNDDFMNALAMALLSWQGHNLYAESDDFDDNHVFFGWCDHIENAVGQPGKAGPNGVGVELALDGYAKWWNTFGVEYWRSYIACPPEYSDAACADSRDPSSYYFTDKSVGSAINLQYLWLLCNEPLGFWQTGAPVGRPSLVSRLTTAEYFTRQCKLLFPTGPHGETYAHGRTVENVNAWTSGWKNNNAKRLLHVSGEFDPWREAGVSSDFRPGGPMISSKQVVVKVVPNGIHATDLLTKCGLANAGVQKVIDEVVQQLTEWVGEWYEEKGLKKPWAGGK